MKILIKIAWRNIWRNPRRSWVLMTTIAVGVIGYLGTASFMRGFMYEMVNSAIQLHAGHIQIFPKGYEKNPNVHLYLENPGQIAQVLSSIPGIRFAPLVSITGMANSSEAASGVVINGIDPEKETEVTIIARSLVDGHYLGKAGEHHQVIIGGGLAKRLNVRVGEKIVLLANAIDNTIASGAYRVAGIYRTASPDFDKAFVYLQLGEVQKLLGYHQQISSFSIRLLQGVSLEKTMQQIKAKIQDGSLEVQSWKDRDPLLVLSLEVFEYFILLFLLIIFVAIAFTIVNSFLMVIYERIREFGVMMAIGIRPKKIQAMLFLETIFMTCLGTLLGTLFSLLILGYWHQHGLDLSNISQALGKFGIGSVIHPELILTDIILGLLVINLLTIIAVFYPALKASRFKVVEAISFV